MGSYDYDAITTEHDYSVYLLFLFQDTFEPYFEKDFFEFKVTGGAQSVDGRVEVYALTITRMDGFPLAFGQEQLFKSIVSDLKRDLFLNHHVYVNVDFNVLQIVEEDVVIDY